MKIDCIERIKDAHLLVAGEVGIDEYIFGNTTRISPEAPVPVIEVESQSQRLGMAANVAQNIASLGGKVTLVSVIGNDSEQDRLTEMVKEVGIGQTCFVEDKSRPTLRKVRVIAQKQHVVRVDYERSHELSSKVAKKFSESICDRLSQVDGVILQDYGKGLWNESTLRFVKMAKQIKKPVFADPSRLSPISLYQGVTLLTPNIAEAEVLCGLMPEKTKKEPSEARLLMMANKILKDSKSDHAIITCGEWGMVSLSRGDKKLNHIPTFAREVFDVTGAGDTVIAVLSLMKVQGLDLTQCMQVANAAAGIVVGRIGASSVTPEELKIELQRLLAKDLLSKSLLLVKKQSPPTKKGSKKYLELDN